VTPFFGDDCVHHHQAISLKRTHARTSVPLTYTHKTQHQNPEFGPKPSEIHKKKRPAKKYISLQGRLAGLKLRNAQFCFVVN
jgi:hypothetical protein